MKKIILFAILLFFHLLNSSNGICQKKTEDLKSVEELIALRDSLETASGDAHSPKRWGRPIVQKQTAIKGTLIYQDSFKNLSNWHHEGIGFLSQPQKNIMQINCVGSAQGGAGCMAFCKKEFPDSIIIEYDLRVLTTNGLVINFIASQGRRGEDMISDLPERKGVFADYVSNPNLRSYHVSVSRYDDDGTHTGVSNWRRNPGLFLMAQQPDLCKEPKRWYHIKIVKSGPFLQMEVDGNLAGGFIDSDEIPEPIPSEGKIGFRAIGKHVLAQIKNFSVYSTR